MRDDPADDWDRYCAGLPRDDGRTLMALCVVCRRYLRADRMVGERNGGHVCDECNAAAKAAE